MRITPSIFLTSDTHFGHRRLVDWGRPEEFNEMILENWNRVVRKDDIVLHLGDLTMVNKEDTRAYTSQLKGRKYIILGNHDDRSNTWYEDLGFTVIPAAFYPYRDKHDNWYKILLTHIPVHPIPEGWFNIHGHLHGNGHRASLQSAQHVDVGVDCFEFTPVRMYKVLDMLLNG